ncbi:hypothetical protein LAZ67_4002234 [Cordylochernes scorpioides]|uniref:Uncharacterized protein n=1 Tax=Cordylochernes scorpioides TaxID=51811 RepID=A0ABY6KCT7_9ARAC|nr:hypothetical protein LAZ67_4002234 [Cordylochernes scorpioides]
MVQKVKEIVTCDNDEKGERFYQDIKVMEERYQGVWDCHMIAHYCWNLSRDLPEYTYKRK